MKERKARNCSTKSSATLHEKVSKARPSEITGLSVWLTQKVLSWGKTNVYGQGC